jgi:hypothetical protein
MTYHLIDLCPHCFKHNAEFHLANPGQSGGGPGAAKKQTRPNSAGKNVYGSVWVCQNCFKIMGASIFVVL